MKAMLVMGFHNGVTLVIIRKANFLERVPQLFE
jgi:Fe2+ transport system protein FeoA